MSSDPAEILHYQSRHPAQSPIWAVERYARPLAVCDAVSRRPLWVAVHRPFGWISLLLQAIFLIGLVVPLLWWDQLIAAVILLWVALLVFAVSRHELEDWLDFTSDTTQGGDFRIGRIRWNGRRVIYELNDGNPGRQLGGILRRPESFKVVEAAAWAIDVPHSVRLKLRRSKVVGPIKRYEWRLYVQGEENRLGTLAPVGNTMSLTLDRSLPELVDPRCIAALLILLGWVEDREQTRRGRGSLRAGGRLPGKV